MCAICIEFQFGNLTKLEAVNAISEMVETGEIKEEHIDEIIELLEEAKEEE